MLPTHYLSKSTDLGNYHIAYPPHSADFNINPIGQMEPPTGILRRENEKRY